MTMTCNFLSTVAIKFNFIRQAALNHPFFVKLFLKTLVAKYVIAGWGIIKLANDKYHPFDYFTYTYNAYFPKSKSILK